MLQIRHLTIRHRKDNRIILEDLSITLHRGDRAALIGEEGNGKSTLLKWIYDPDLVSSYADAEGERSCRGEVLAFLPQELPEEDRDRPVREYLSDLPAFLSATPADLSGTASALGFSPALFESDRPMGTLSGGERIKVRMAGLLLGRPDFLLLDEPSNDLDLDGLKWLERTISSFPGGVLYISHDETLLDKTADRIILLEQLRKKTLSRVTEKALPFRTFMEERERAFEKQAREAQSERREEKKAMDRYRRIRQAVERDLKSVSRQDPSSGRLLKKKMKAVKSLERRRERERADMTRMPEAETGLTFRFEGAGRMPAGKRVLDLALPVLTSPDGRILARDLDLSIRGPEKVCVIGPNGSGKTTLIRRAWEDLKERTDITAFYMSQDYADTLPLEEAPLDYLAPSGDREEMSRARTFLGSMHFRADEVVRPIRDLSGGQKARLLLLKMSLSGADVLVLDEPTRNLSPLSAPEIRAVLRLFPGAILCVSHDRTFIREVCGRVLVLTGEGLKEAEDAESLLS